MPAWSGSTVLDRLTHTDFQEQLGTTFRLRVGEDGTLDLELSEVSLLGRESESGRRAFSLLFRGPHAPLLVQRIYGLEHEQLGLLKLFLVPLGPDRGGLLYEAVFT